MIATALRRARPDDAAALATLKSLCFRQTFLEDLAVPYPPGEIALFEERAYSPATVAGELANPREASWLVEMADRTLVGYVRAGPCKLPHIEQRETDGEIYQLYIRRDAQGSGLGKALMAVALEWLNRHYPGPVWLGVWSGNDRAQRFYARHGFSKVGEYLFPVGDEWQDHEFIYRRAWNAA